MDESEKRELVNGYVNLREHFDMLISERDKRLDLRFETLAQALLLASANTKERLTELNNLRKEYTEDRSKDQEHYVKADVYYPKMKEMDLWKEKVDNQLTTINTRSITWSMALGVFFTILMIILKVW